MKSPSQDPSSLHLLGGVDIQGSTPMESCRIEVTQTKRISNAFKS